MNSASPTTSASTNRGGRPKDWTEPRARRLVRLYIYTRLPFDLILKLLEDGVWKPGKDAANKVKNSLLGNDPRWIRPKDDEDERRRIAALKNSRRGAKLRHRTSISHFGRDHCNTCIPGCYDEDCLTPAQSSHHSFDKSSPGTQLKYETIDPTGQIGSSISNIGYDEHVPQAYPPWVTSGMDSSRQDTDLTNSTETSMSSSFREKLSSVSRDQAKGAWRVLKQFTFPKDSDLQRGTSFSPVVSPGSQLQSTHRVLHNPDGLAALVPSSARYAVPGDFLDANLFARRSLCETGSISHEMGTCWCRIVNDLTPIKAFWPIDSNYLSAYDNYSNDFYQRTDAFGNTAFHHLAAMNGNRISFLNFISQAQGNPNLPVRLTNTAGQTFLHVLHQSWFDEEVLLERLLNILKDADFDILATDVYGRSFFHLLQNKKLDSARIPAHLFDWNLLKRRDAFGVKPMESRPRHTEPATAQTQRRASFMDARTSGRMEIPPTMLDIPSDRGDESRIRPQAELLRIVVDAVKVDGVNSTNPNPRSEDSRGRNALHCLAEVELDVDRVQDPALDNQRQKKRKYKEEELESRPESSRSARRLDFLEGILSANVDVNHYDNQGQTPLMAFIKYRPEDSRSDKETMERIIKMLHFADANLEARNREGETALHVAARSGKKVALKELLQLGANPYVRDACGLSVLAAIDDRWANAEDGVHIARLEACRGVFTSIVQSAAQEPTVLQEWGVRQSSA
ncbi:ankyrin [Annulohypoxylon bovei var. microspora]|nr:ankyrin [Annulohypoxylon bovei var. microspora]